MKYKVEVTTIKTYELFIEADSPEEAITETKLLYKNKDAKWDYALKKESMYGIDIFNLEWKLIKKV